MTGYALQSMLAFGVPYNESPDLPADTSETVDDDFASLVEHTPTLLPIWEDAPMLTENTP